VISSGHAKRVPQILSTPLELYVIFHHNTITIYMSKRAASKSPEPSAPVAHQVKVCGQCHKPKLGECVVLLLAGLLCHVHVMIVC
jgi:hypothetical protein